MSISSELEAPADLLPAGASTPAGSLRRPATWREGLLLATTAVVIAVHFRPWQGGLLEDWELALAWRHEGLAGYLTRLPLLAGRPFHLLPAYLGLALTDGGVAGQYLVLAGVAVAQFVLGMWAAGPLVRNWWVRWVLAAAIALHPWWMAGDVLRYLPAQTSILAVVIWFGCAVRYLRAGRPWHLVLGGAALGAGLLTYQAPAVAALGGSLALAVTTPVVGRAVRLCLTTGAVVGAVLCWSLLVAPRLAPQSYESQLFAGRNLGLLPILHAVLRTLALHGSGVLLLLCSAAAVIVAVGLEQLLEKWQVWSLLAVTLGAPVAAFMYAATPVQLNDPERVIMPTGVLLWLVLACVVDRVTQWRRAAVGLLAVSLTAMAVGAMVGYVRWSRFADEQQELISASAAFRSAVPPGDVLVVADMSGRYGDVYLLIPPHLEVALDVEHGPGPEAVLCTPEGTVKDQPVAALFPIVTTPDCSTYTDSGVVTMLGSVRTSLGRVVFYAAPHAAAS